MTSLRLQDEGVAGEWGPNTFFLSPTVGKRPRHGGAQLLAVSLWGAPCSSAQGPRNLENQGGGNWFIINLQQ